MNCCRYGVKTSFIVKEVKMRVGIQPRVVV